MSTLVTSVVAVILLLQPIQFLHLPFNMSLVEVWSVFALPICWMALVQGRHPIRLPYLPVMFVILMATGIASLLSPMPTKGLLVLVREVYLYAWAITLAAVFENVRRREFHKLLWVWCAVTCAHGLVILAQFVHPPLLDEMNRSLAGLGVLDPYRPSGLVKNSNLAAVVQIGGFIPLALLGLPRRRLVLLGALLFASVLGTGSMGATLAVVSGLVVGLVVLAGYYKDWSMAVTITVGASLTAGLLVGVFLVLASSSPELDTRLDEMLFGRSERSADSRFAIWNRGLDVAMGETTFWGIGPDTFGERAGSELHNDLLSFAVERGFFGVLGLVLFAVLFLVRSVAVLGAGRARGERGVVVFPAAAAAFLVESLTHEVFHMRALWLVLALQEAVLWRARRAAASEPDIAEPRRELARSPGQA